MHALNLNLVDDGRTLNDKDKATEVVISAGAGARGEDESLSAHAES